MDDGQTPIKPQLGRGNKQPTRLKHFSLRRVAGEKIHIDIDVNTGVASGPNVETFNNYLGVVSIRTEKNSFRVEMVQLK